MSERHRTSLEEVLAAIDDVQLTQRFGDYRIDPQAVPAEALRDDYVLLFAEPYIDPDAFRSNRIPDFMVTALVRMFYGLLDYAYMIRTDAHVPVNSYWLLAPQREALLAEGFTVFATEYQERFRSQLMCLRTSRGLFFAPMDMLADPLTQQRLQEELLAA